MTAPTVKLTDIELDRALALIIKYGTSSFFPEPFEFEAIQYSWSDIKPVLEKIELLNYEPRSAFQLTVPKQRYSVRPVHSLDPLDLVLYTGLAARLASKIESNRLSSSQVYSSRWRDGDPTSVVIENDWDGFQNSINVRLTDTPFFAVADISDFFARVNLHKLENALQATSGLEYEVRAMMRLLKAWTDGTSYGIPTGPFASNLLAEALLIEVDDYLLGNGLSFCRYVDDYVFFVSSEAEGIRALYMLAERLQKSQGLALNMAKTRVSTQEAMLIKQRASDTPEEMLRARIIKDVFGGDPYAEVDFEQLDKAQRELLAKLNLDKSLGLELQREVLDLTSIKFLLNVMASLKRPESVTSVLESLERLYPVAESLVRFFGSMDQLSPAQAKKVGSSIVNYIKTARYVPDYQLIWLLELFVRSVRWDNLDEIRHMASQHANIYVRRQATLALENFGDRSALLDRRHAYRDCLPMEQWAILKACARLPKDEREGFYKSVQGTGWSLGNAVGRAVIERVRSI